MSIRILHACSMCHDPTVQFKLIFSFNLLITVLLFKFTSLKYKQNACRATLNEWAFQQTSKINFTK